MHDTIVNNRCLFSPVGCRTNSRKFNKGNKMDIMSLATKVLMSKIGNANDASVAESAIGELLGGNDNFDLADLVGRFTGAGGEIATKAESWLGDGANDEISAGQIKETLGADKIEAFAAKLGVGSEEASKGLSEMLPQLIDKGSRGGSLLDSIGGVGGLASLASKILK